VADGRPLLGYDREPAKHLSPSLSVVQQAIVHVFREQVKLGCR